MKTIAGLGLACAMAVAVQAHAEEAPPTGAEREALLAYIAEIYPGMPQPLLERYADVDGQLHQAACDVLDWIASAPAGVPSDRVDVARPTAAPACFLSRTSALRLRRKPWEAKPTRSASWATR